MIQELKEQLEKRKEFLKNYPLDTDLIPSQIARINNIQWKVEILEKVIPEMERMDNELRELRDKNERLEDDSDDLLLLDL